jgi:LmbE family N-acetylglucosaminyl deacetylase
VPTKHIFVSPHFDDGIGSCGGTISRLERSGEEVVVHTISGASPSPPYSRLALELHGQWRCGDSPVGFRSTEDACACQVLGCAHCSSEILDAIYRKSPTGAHLYPDQSALFGRITDDDGDLHTRITGEVRARWTSRDTRLYFPLGVGHHVDHVVAFRAGLACLKLGCQVWFYQDFFYTDWNCPHLEGTQMHACVQPFSSFDFERKLKAFGRYQSQIAMLFGSAGKAASYFAQANRIPDSSSEFREVFWQLTS